MVQNINGMYLQSGICRAQAYFEAIVNTLIHRNYFETGSEIHIDIYENRLTIWSPEGMTKAVFSKNNLSLQWNQIEEIQLLPIYFNESVLWKEI